MLVDAKVAVNTSGFAGRARTQIDNGVLLNGRSVPSQEAATSSFDGPESDGAGLSAPSGSSRFAAPNVSGARPRAAGAPQRHAMLEPPSDRLPPAPIAPTTGAPEIRSTPRSPSTSVDAALRDAAAASGVDVNVLRGIASIESSENPASNRNRRTQYKGLFQLGHEEWARYGKGDIYNAHDNAMAAARKFTDDRAWFKSRYGREPSDRELYMIHQQGRGFFTRGAMTNIAGNRYPGMRGPQSQASFEAGWGRELKRREDAFRRRAAGKPPAITLK